MGGIDGSSADLMRARSADVRRVDWLLVWAIGLAVLMLPTIVK
jgi:hypothetical protein